MKIDQEVIEEIASKFQYAYKTKPAFIIIDLSHQVVVEGLDTRDIREQLVDIGPVYVTTVDGEPLVILKQPMDKTTSAVSNSLTLLLSPELPRYDTEYSLNVPL